MSTVLSHPATSELVERILTEGPLGATAAAKLFGSFREGKPAHPATVCRWINDGIQIPGGGRLRLDGVRIAGRLVTSRPAIVRFIAAQQATPDQAAVETPAERKQTDAAAERILDAAGIK